jgi:hypothetical protein
MGAADTAPAREIAGCQRTYRVVDRLGERGMLAGEPALVEFLVAIALRGSFRRGVHSRETEKEATLSH